jgi:DNA-binding LytR/AlgR family response regulator
MPNTTEYNCIIIDDYEVDLKKLEQFVVNFNDTNNHRLHINIVGQYQTFDHSVNALGSLKVDFIFLDLTYGEDFQDLGERFLSILRPTFKVIIVSGFIPTTLGDKYPNIIDMIHKPNLDDDTISNAIEKFWIDKENLRVVFSVQNLKVIIDGEWKSILYDDIFCVKSDNRINTIVLRDQPPIKLHANFVSLRDFDGREPFLRVATHCVINKTKIERVRRNKPGKLLLHINGTEIEVGGAYVIDIANWLGQAGITVQ